MIFRLFLRGWVGWLRSLCVGWAGVENEISTNHNSSWSCICSWVRKSPENKLSRVGGVAGWLDQVGIKLSQLSTKLKLKLKLSLAKV